MGGTPGVAARGGAAYLGLSKNQRLTELCRKIDAGGDGGRSPEHLAQYDLMPCRKFVSGILSIGAFVQRKASRRCYRSIRLAPRPGRLGAMCKQMERLTLSKWNQHLIPLTGSGSLKPSANPIRSPNQERTEQSAAPRASDPRTL